MGRRLDNMTFMWRHDRKGFLVLHAALVAVMGGFGLVLWGACHASPEPVTTRPASFNRLAESIFQEEVKDWRQRNPGVEPSAERLGLLRANAELEAQVEETHPIR